MGDPGRSTRPDDEDAVLERDEAELAGSEAAAIGGAPQSHVTDPAMRPVYEGGEGEAEGFEEAEEELIEHASHGDEQSAHAVLHHQGADEEPGTAADGEADHELSSEVDEDLWDEDEEPAEDDYDEE